MHKSQLFEYRFWRYASSAATRPLFPRRPWLQVRRVERRAHPGSSPLARANRSGPPPPPCCVVYFSEPSSAAPTNCHSLHRLIHQEFSLPPCEPDRRRSPGPAVEEVKKEGEEEAEETEEIKPAELFEKIFQALSGSAHLAESVNHMTESSWLSPAHQVESRQSSRRQSSQWLRDRLWRHLVAPAALSSHRFRQTLPLRTSTPGNNRQVLPISC